MFVLAAVLSVVVDTALLLAVDAAVEEVDDALEELDVDDEPSDDKKGAACFELLLRVATPTLFSGQPLSSHPI